MVDYAFPFEDEQREIASLLLQNDSVTITNENNQVLSPGIQGPLVIDLKKIFQTPYLVSRVCSLFSESINEYQPSTIVGANIVGSLLAANLSFLLKLPLAYAHRIQYTRGLHTHIEGANVSENRVMIITDQMVTGESVYAIADECKKLGAHIIRVVALFSYQMREALQILQHSNLPLTALTTIQVLFDEACDAKMVNSLKHNAVTKWINANCM